MISRLFDNIYPQIIINSVPSPELIENSDNLDSYIRGLRELSKLKPDFIVMVCNTIHLYYNLLQSKISIPIIDLRLEVKKHLVKKNIKSALIIGTSETIKRGLYNFNSLKCVTPNYKEVKDLSGAIYNFNKGSNKKYQICLTKKICKKYLKRGVKTIILGCTEFAVMLKNEKFSKINTLDILVEAIVNKFKEYYGHGR